jgi:acetylornithine deacetylase
MPENPSASATVCSPDLDPVRLASQLIAVPSVNPGLVPGAEGEKGMAGFCSQWLGERGFEVRRLEKHPGRPSIVAIARGTGGGRSLMLNGHLDTVGVASYEGDPFEPRPRDGKLYGRGAFDMKGGVAAMMMAAVRATSPGPLRGDVIVACVCDEENDSYGTEEVLEHVSADAAVVTEPSHLEVTLAHKGFALFEVEIVGRTAHGSQPELGVDAIAKAGHFLIALERLGQRLAEGRRHPLLGTGGVRASLIHGGEELFTIPAHCRVTVERRTVPGEDAESVTQELTRVLDHLAGTVPGFGYRLTPGLRSRRRRCARRHRVGRHRLAAPPHRHPHRHRCGVLLLRSRFASAVRAGAPAAFHHSFRPVSALN